MQISRRDVLKTLGLAATVVPVIGSSAANVSAAPTTFGTWEFSPSGGIWCNAKMTHAMQCRVGTLRAFDGPAKYGSVVTTVDGLRKVQEYGLCIDGDGLDDIQIADILVEQMRAVSPHVLGWTLLPEVRRDDASHWRCSCGRRFKMPTDFGREDWGRAVHIKAHPAHTMTWTAKLGYLVGWYGLGVPKSMAPPRSGAELDERRNFVVI